MDRQVAETLVDELSKHAGIANVDGGVFLGVLLAADVPQSSRFYEPLPDEKQLVQESRCYHFLSLSRVLRNGTAGSYRLSRAKQAYEAMASAIGIYDSDTLSRNLRANGDLVEMMAESEHPFSLLAKLQTYDYYNPEGDLFVITKPVLVIPDASDTAKICAWEDANTTYEQEREALFFTRRKKIRPEVYLSR